MGFLGCALMPVIQGWLADQPGLGLQQSYSLSFLAYAAVLAYAWKAWDGRSQSKSTL
jgi:fucose permease